jgi:hypothetical protein
MSPLPRYGLALALLGAAAGAHPALAQTTQDYGTTVVDPFLVNEASFTTTTDAGSPTFNRPGLANVPGVTEPPTSLSAGGTAVAYAAHGFTASQDATYYVSTTINAGYADPKASPNGTDNFVQALYASDPKGKTATFDPANPLQNAVLAYSQGQSGDGYFVDLSGGGQYTFVNAGYYNANQTGAKLSLGTATTSVDRLDYGTTTFIPDADILGNSTAVSQTLTLSGGSPITAFNSFSIIGLSDSAAGDLSATLTHAGKTVTLFDQPASGQFGQLAAFDGSQTYQFADSGQDLATALNDTVNDPSKSKFGPFPLAGGTFKSLGLLSVFDGTDLAGDWTLRVVDNQNGSTGSFLGFTFNASSSGPAAVPEASTWVGMGLGCLSLAALAFRRRRAALS